MTVIPLEEVRIRQVPTGCASLPVLTGDVVSKGEDVPLGFHTTLSDCSESDEAV